MKRVEKHWNNIGFTLYEMLVVLAILSILSTIGTVSLLGVREKSRLTGLANAIKSDLNRGKIIAARNKGYVVLQVSEKHYDMFIDNGAGGATAGDWRRERLRSRPDALSRLSPNSMTKRCGRRGLDPPVPYWKPLRSAVRSSRGVPGFASATHQIQSPPQLPAA